MNEEIKKYCREIEAFPIQAREDIDAFKRKYTSKKGGVITELLSRFKSFSVEEKKQYGKQINELKTIAEKKIKEGLGLLNGKPTLASREKDLTLPGEGLPMGGLHPLTIVGQKINNIFSRMGFSIAEGPELEDDWYNFTALNFPPYHPARDMQDTFFITAEKENNQLLRTHTSTVQVRLMEKQPPPIRSIMPGRVYRNETISARAHCIFHQVEGLYVDRGVSFADLKQCIYGFAEEMFGQGTKLRFRPSYFPFTEPSAEVDISCFICGQKGCNICKHSGWVEIMGCGMVHPNVLTNCGIDAGKYTGYAFGMGIERITMLKYNIPDLRLFFENDIRFLSQFNSINI